MECKDKFVRQSSSAVLTVPAPHSNLRAAFLALEFLFVWSASREVLMGENGQGELYAYLPLTAPNAARLLVVPGSRQNPDYEFSVGRGAFGFEGGRWTTVAQRVRLNDIGQENGGVEVYIDGTSVICVKGLTLRDDAASHVKGLHFQTFFGGSSPEWASPKDQRAWFAGASGAILK
ncbi:hypothetical protein GLOTRDRAFT_138978 [Gloeophyllum trabeum ATCC 11539]|uniref:Polysaccharide lyase 14 domain-containing protein n=1 Tax=Gloeophyllum trabeum (strain ATCC 11539 / FP-39264 / Madison 617) TaxID=670483 RepID=S7Q5V5_GLOTA|nr:uncharacterized protein GLOTRDRAFT_138978 [Gloeophyllum trabeum ATCC 11539]EPQ55441.1 hypothetical protein GLOTRDRAFT_138978 [Gloeophyllum trabeum ATCC 11539]